MKCSVNRNLEIDSRKKELLMDLARPEDILEKIGLVGDPDNILWEVANTKIKEFFTDKLPKEWRDSKRFQQLSWAGLEKTKYDRLSRSWVSVWVKYHDSPKLAIFLWLGEGEELRYYIPWRGNPINPKTGRPIGWDTGYIMDQSLWAQTYKDDYEFVCKELYGKVIDMEEGSDIIYDIVHSGILEPDWLACESEFQAYTSFL